MIIEFPRRLRTNQDREDEIILEILQVIYDEFVARGYDPDPYLGEIESLLSEIVSE